MVCNKEPNNFGNFVFSEGEKKKSGLEAQERDISKRTLQVDRTPLA